MYTFSFSTIYTTIYSTIYSIQVHKKMIMAADYLEKILLPLHIGDAFFAQHTPATLLMLCSLQNNKLQNNKNTVL